MGLKLLAPSLVINNWSQRTVTPALRSGMTPVQRSTAINAAAADAAGKTLLLESAEVDTALQLGGVREVRGYGGGRATLDFSGRASATSLVKASGSVSSTSHALTSNAGRSQAATDEILISSAYASIYPVGSVVRITSAAVEFPGASIAIGERVEIVGNQTTGGTTTLTTLAPMIFDYLTTDTAVIALVSEQDEIEISRIDLIGTGNTYVDDPPLNAQGDHGFVLEYYKRALIGDCRSYHAERNAFRIANCKDFVSENNYALFADAVTTSQIKYGHTLIGYIDEGRIRNSRCEGEFRHAIDCHGGGPGAVKRIITEGNTAVGGYEEAYNQHDLVLDWVSIDDKAEKCGAGFGARSKAKFIRPVIKDCYDTIGGNAFAIVDVADVEIHHPTVDNVRFICRSSNDDDIKMFADNTAPVRVEVYGGLYRRFGTGWFFTNLGLANTTLAGYNTRKLGPIAFHGGDYLCDGPREAPNVSARPISVEGYAERLTVDGVTISFKDVDPDIIRNSAVISLGVDHTIITGANVWTETRGLLQADKAGMLDANGDAYISQAGRLDVLREPIIIDHVAGYGAINSYSDPDIAYVSRTSIIREIHDVDGPVTVTLPAGYEIASIYINNTIASGLTGGLKIGTTLGGDDVVTGFSVGGLSNFLIPDATILKPFISGTADQILYIDAVTSFNNAVLELAFVFTKVRSTIQ